MKSFSVIVSLICSVMALRGSPQIPDSLVTEDGEKKWVHNFDLGDDGKEALRKWVEADRAREVYNTGNHDGFYAELVIKQNKLYVRSVAVDAASVEDGSHRAHLPWAILFRSKFPVFADWFTGDLYEYYGERMGNTGQKSRVRTYSFERGVLIRIHHQKTSDLK